MKRGAADRAVANCTEPTVKPDDAVAVTAKSGSPATLLGMGAT